MDLSKIIAISGYPGLFKVVAQAHNGIIVESLIDKKRMHAFSTFKISALDDISIFTNSDDMPLKEVLAKIFEKEKGPIDTKKVSSNDDLKSFVKSIIPDYDQDRVHLSDMKKLVSWYNILEKAGLLIESKENKAPESTETEQAAETKPKTKKAATKSASKTRVEAGNTKVGAANAKGARKTTTVRKTGG
ncbi:MAG: DUF5606 domain-containing protein [Bacteroidia bacterium]|nr:DUF5606 domain-containing protein [Bacteroidia bacterium]MCZ2247731.1 DUF5606 domain-containing protein [Bacteroidia bacterium]